MIRIIALAMLLAAVGQGLKAAPCDPFATAVATDPAPYQYPRGVKTAHALLAHIPERADIILIGDSLVANWPDDMARRQFGSDHVWNFAVGGAVTQNTLWQIEAPGLDKLDPKALVVLVGTNNLTREDMPACAIASGIQAVIAAAHRKWPAAHIHVMGIPPRGTDFHFRNDSRLAVNAELKNWARSLKFVRYFEVNAEEMTCGLYGRRGHTASPCANYADDFGHFKRGGYEVLYRAMQE